MALSEQLKFILTADVGSAVKGFEQVAKSGSQLENVSGKMKKAGAGAMAFAGIAGAALFKAAGSFQDLAISAGKFSDTTGLAIEDASRWIEVAGDMGISTETIEGSLNKMNKTLGATPEVFREAGVAIATTATGAVDVNATFLGLIDKLNGMEDPAARAALATATLGKGWTNMSELIAQGSGSLKQSLDSVSEAKVINSEEEQKAKDYRAAIDSFNDSIQDLVISIGQGAAPMLGQLASTAGAMIGVFSGLDKVTGGAAGTFATTGVAIIGAAGALSFASGKAIELAGKFKAMGAAGQTAGVLAGLGLFAMSMHAKQAAERAADVRKSIEDLSKVADKEVLKTFVEGLSKAFLGGGGPKKYIEDLAEANIEGARRLREHITATGEMTSALPMLTDAIAKAEAETKQATATTKEFGTANDETYGVVEDAVDVQKRMEAASKASKEAFDAEIEALEAKSKALQESVERINEQVDAMHSAADANFAVADASDEFNGFLGELNEKLKEAGKNQAAVNAVYREGTQKADGLAEATLRMHEEQAKANGTTLTQTQRQDIWNQQMLNAARTASGPLRQSIIDYIGQVNQIPAEKVSEIAALIKQGKLDEAKAALDGASAARNATITADAQTAEANAELDAVAAKRRVAQIEAHVASISGAIYAGGAGTVPRGATGGIVTRPTLAMIGEAGPEAVVPLNRTPGSSPLPGGMGGGLTIQVNMAGYKGDGYAAARDFQAGLKQFVQTNGPGEIKRLLGIT